MVLMAGMLPGVECARRRRVRQAVAEAPPGGTRRPSLCLYTAAGHGHARLGSKEIRSSACREKETAHAWMLDSNAREAKERLDQKLRGQRESVGKRRQSTSTSQEARAASSGRDGINNEHSATTAPQTGVLQREVLTKNRAPAAGAAGRRRFVWSGLRRRPPAPASEAGTECAVCLEELQAGDVLVHLPCAHRFHWACAVPWVQAASRCPVCRAHVHLLAEQEQPAAAG